MTEWTIFGFHNIRNRNGQFLYARIFFQARIISASAFVFKVTIQSKEKRFDFQERKEKKLLTLHFRNFIHNYNRFKFLFCLNKRSQIITRLFKVWSEFLTTFGISLSHKGDGRFNSALLSCFDLNTAFYILSETRMLRNDYFMFFLRQ